MRGGGFAGSARRRVRSGGATSSYGSFEEPPGNLLGTFSYRWSDEFLKLVGPEVGRESPSIVPNVPITLVSIAPMDPIAFLLLVSKIQNTNTSGIKKGSKRS